MPDNINIFITSVIFDESSVDKSNVLVELAGNSTPVNMPFVVVMFEPLNDEESDVSAEQFWNIPSASEIDVPVNDSGNDVNV